MRRLAGSRIVIASFCCLSVFLAESVSQAGSVQVSFSGGSGTPLTVTLPQPVVFTVTSPPNAGATIFGFLNQKSCKCRGVEMGNGRPIQPDRPFRRLYNTALLSPH